MDKRIAQFGIGCSILALAWGANAAVVSGEGEYRFGPETAENIACAISLDKAKENAIQNFVGEFIENETNEICKDEYCTTYRKFFSQTSGQIKRIISKESIVAPEKKHSICITTIEAEVEKVENTIDFKIESKTHFKHGERFFIKAISNRVGRFGMFNVVGDEYRLVYHGTIVSANNEFVLPQQQKFQALLKPGQHQSKELMVFMFTEENLTFRQTYSTMEFERLVKDLPFSGRKIVVQPINIVR